MKLKFISILFMLGFVCVSMAKAEELMLETVEVTAQRLPLSAYGPNEPAAFLHRPTTRAYTPFSPTTESTSGVAWRRMPFTRTRATK